MLHGLQPAPASGVLALFIALRDMGNGVLRIDAARWVRFRPEAHPDFGPVALPFSAAVSDALGCALVSLGVLERQDFTKGRARSVDAVTELYVRGDAPMRKAPAL